MGRTSRAVVGLGSWVAVVACAACSAEAPDTSFDETGEEALGSEQAPNILFPGDPACGGGCEKSLAGDEVFIPATNGKPWGQTYLKGTSTPKTLGGYSSGRIALLRRLALKNDGDWAVMLDPSWDDGTRDFLDDDNPATRPSVKPTTGPAIVKAWLAARADRRFLLVYSTTSAGSKGYAALASDPEVGSRVRACAVTVGHLDVPKTVGAKVMTQPAEWITTSCKEPAWDCARSAFQGKQYLTCDGSTLRKCEGGVPIPVKPEHRCAKGCVSAPAGTDDSCAP